jgi:hypothetical protein
MKKALAYRGLAHRYSQISVFWNITLCIPLKVKDMLENYAALYHEVIFIHEVPV